MFMGTKRNYLLLTVLFPLFAVGQSVGNVNCKRVKNGTFYFYPPKSKGFTLVRKGGVQAEIDHSNGDTTFWKINWISDCVFDLKFIRKSRPMSLYEEKYFNAHTAVFEVLKSEKDYYIFKVRMDSISNLNSSTDTVWLNPK